LRDVALHQRGRELALVLEVIEEAALGDAGGGDQFFDRCGGEALLENGGLGQFQDALPRRGAFAWRHFKHAALYHRYSCRPRLSHRLWRGSQRLRLSI
jgi:hypothetical protein